MRKSKRKPNDPRSIITRIILGQPFAFEVSDSLEDCEHFIEQRFNIQQQRQVKLRRIDADHMHFRIAFGEYRSCLAYQPPHTLITGTLTRSNDSTHIMGNAHPSRSWQFSVLVWVLLFAAEASLLAATALMGTFQGDLPLGGIGSIGLLFTLSSVYTLNQRVVRSYGLFRETLRE